MITSSNLNQSIELESIPGNYSIHKLRAGNRIPEISRGFYSITSTLEEISVVCLDENKINSVSSSKGWKCLRVSGPIELELVGILHHLTRPLKEAGISVFAISTYNTDYLFIPKHSYRGAIQALSREFVISQG